MATPEDLVLRPDNRPLLRVVYGPEEQEKLWKIGAGQIQLEALDYLDEDDQTHVLKRFGEDIGAAGVFSRTIELGSRRARAVEVESFATNEAYYHTGYLALVTSLIDNGADILVIDGAPGEEMAAVASDLAPCLPMDWVCEYNLLSSRGGIEVSTFDSSLLAAHLARQGRAGHAFKKI